MSILNGLVPCNSISDIPLYVKLGCDLEPNMKLLWKEARDNYFMQAHFWMDVANDLFVNELGAFLENIPRNKLIGVKLEDYAYYKINYIDRGCKLVLGRPAPEFNEWGNLTDNTGLYGIYVSNYIDIIKDEKRKIK